MTDDERRLGELMRATKVAICNVLAQDPSSGTDSDWMRRVAEGVAAYPISSKRRLQAMRAELDATVRDLRRQVSLGRWSQRSYKLLVERLRAEGLVDISTWVDSGTERMKQVLERGEIRTVAELRLATEYRDFADAKVQSRVDDLIASYESARRGVRLQKQARPRSGSKSAARKLSSEELAFVDLLRRSAIAAFEHAARADRRAEAKLVLEDRAKVWRTIEIATRRDLKGLERGFWVSIAQLRNRLTKDEFRELAAEFNEAGLIDISSLVETTMRKI